MTDLEYIAANLSDEDILNAKCSRWAKRIKESKKDD